MRYALFWRQRYDPGLFFEGSRGGNGEKAGDQFQRRLGRSERAMEAAFGDPGRRAPSSGFAFIMIKCPPEMHFVGHGEPAQYNSRFFTCSFRYAKRMLMISIWQVLTRHSSSFADSAPRALTAQGGQRTRSPVQPPPGYSGRPFF